MYQYIIHGVKTIIIKILELLPNADINIINYISSNLTVFKGYLAQVDFVLPIGSLFTVLGFMITIETIIFGYKVVTWVATHLTGGFIKHK